MQCTRQDFEFHTFLIIRKTDGAAKITSENVRYAYCLTNNKTHFYPDTIVPQQLSLLTERTFVHSHSSSTSVKEQGVFDLTFHAICHSIYTTFMVYFSLCISFLTVSQAQLILILLWSGLWSILSVVKALSVRQFWSFRGDSCMNRE